MAASLRCKIYIVQTALKSVTLHYNDCTQCHILLLSMYLSLAINFRSAVQQVCNTWLRFVHFHLSWFIQFNCDIVFVQQQL